VLVTDVDEASAEQTAGLLGGESWSMKQDVRDPESHRRVAEAAAERGPIHTWVNNAGVLRTGLAWEHDDETVKLQIDVNVLGVIYGSRAAVDSMSQTGGGHIINLSSISGLCPAPGLAVYGASKHAVLGFSLSLQGDLDNADVPIRVTAVCPDTTDTALIRNVEADEHAGLVFSAGGLLDPDEVADATVKAIDDYKLLLVLPPARGAMTHLLRPFPALGLRLLRAFNKRGNAYRRKHGII